MFCFLQKHLLQNGRQRSSHMPTSRQTCSRRTGSTSDHLSGNSRPRPPRPCGRGRHADAGRASQAPTDPLSTQGCSQDRRAAGLRQGRQVPVASQGGGAGLPHHGAAHARGSSAEARPPGRGLRPSTAESPASRLPRSRQGPSLGVGGKGGYFPGRPVARPGPGHTLTDLPPRQPRPTLGAPLGLVFLKPVTPRRCSPHGSELRQPHPCRRRPAPVFRASVPQGGCGPGLPPRPGPARYSPAFFSCLLGSGSLCTASGGRERGHPPPPAPPRPPWTPTIGRVGSGSRGRDLKGGWPAGPPPLTSLPPHVSRPGWYPLPWEAAAGGRGTS